MYILTSMQQFPAQRRHKAFKKKEGCVCKRSPGREENSLLGKRRKEVYLRVKYCGPLKGTERGTQSRDKCFTDENTDFERGEELLTEIKLTDGRERTKTQLSKF